MKPLYTDIEFEQAKSRSFLPLECEYCHKTFKRIKHDIQSANLKQGNNNNSYCSRDCSNLSQQVRIKFNCFQCGVELTRFLSVIKKSSTQRFFCSKSCAGTYNSTHKTKGTRVSKLELYLQKELTKLYPDLEFHFNRKDAINGELDIYIPSLKLAFELNGIFHYEPIYGLEQLAKTQNNDTRKFQACLEKGISLCIIDSSAQKYVKESTSKKYLDIIVEIIYKHRGS